MTQIIRILSILSFATLVYQVPVTWAAIGQANITGTQADSEIEGTAILEETALGLSISVTLRSVPQGVHGIHIHQLGSCDDGGVAAGGHFNPDQSDHGFLPNDGLTLAHGGDMGNIEIGSDGSGSLEIDMPDLSLIDGPYAVAGRAIILHEKRDDFGQPTGNAGARIGCGPIVLTSE